MASTSPRSASGGAAPGKGSIGPSSLACTADAARSVNAATNISARMNALTARAAPGSNDRALPKIDQRTCAACRLLLVDPRLLDHERLPESRSDPFGLAV